MIRADEARKKDIATVTSKLTEYGYNAKASKNKEILVKW